ncbi:hypothetical protein LSTR_LSTR003329 [Laodelphax striatellus]|uniref:Uncharacterized protein n=1 Tax=Laodelphax striatellus TaxID=195883 RepID=A0A482X4M2_LAOST|nr:hypothetical protein LSTR_LSTR003329 [Laodelphax striatellus]
MALMQSCCCWRSLRKGCYASAAFTMVYFTSLIINGILFFQAERFYYAGVVDVPISASILEPEAITPATMGFHVVLFACALAGLITSSLLVYGIYKDERTLLIPWIVNVATTAVVNLAHGVYVVFSKSFYIHPLTGILYTMDFFLLSLNIYCIVCVVSQYQEYKAGRGTASHDMRNCRTPPVKYLAKSGSVATVALSGRKGAAGGRNCDVDEEMSPQGESTEKTEEVPSGPGSAGVPKHGSSKKHVKFGDNEEFHIQYSIISKEAHSDGNGTAIIAGVDSEPLIQKRHDIN